MDQILITVITSIVAALITSILAHREIKRRAEIDLQNQYATRFNEKKWVTYIKFVDSVRELFVVSQTNKKNNKYPDFLSLTTDLFLIGSDSVILSYKAWRVRYDTNGPFDQNTLFNLFDLVVEMRKDLGNNKTELDYEDLLGSLIPNYKRSL
jgi:hypothetical protein